MAGDQETISAIPPYCALWGFWVSQPGQLGAMPPPPFLSVSPLESMRSGGAIPAPQKGYLSDTCVIPSENKANGCDTPLCDTISKGYCAIWGGISHWAAKRTPLPLANVDVARAVVSAKALLLDHCLSLLSGISKPIVWGTVVCTRIPLVFVISVFSVTSANPALNSLLVAV